MLPYDFSEPRGRRFLFAVELKTFLCVIPKADVLRLRGAARRSNLNNMSTIEEIEDAVRRLSAQELAAFRTWFAEFDAAAWDRQIEQDIAAGRLDAVADEALDDLRQGRCTDR
jgi:hypothetical protein